MVLVKKFFHLLCLSKVDREKVFPSDLDRKKAPSKTFYIILDNRIVDLSQQKNWPFPKGNHSSAITVPPSMFHHHCSTVSPHWSTITVPLFHQHCSTVPPHSSTNTLPLFHHTLPLSLFHCSTTTVPLFHHTVLPTLLHCFTSLFHNTVQPTLFFSSTTLFLDRCSTNTVPPHYSTIPVSLSLFHQHCST